MKVPMMPEITILIPVYNGECFLKQAIESILEQTFDRFSLVISDNCSSDKTVSIVKGYLSDSRVTLVVQPYNCGMVGNFNNCLKLVNTKYFMLISHDDFLFSKYSLEQAFQLIESYPEVSTVYSDMVYVDGKGKIITLRKFGRKELVDSLEIAKSSVISGRNLYGIPLLTRSSTIRGLECDEKLTYVFDLDLYVSLTKGKKIFHIPEPLIAYRCHEENSTVILLGKTREQMEIIAAKHGIPLSKFDKLRMRLNAGFVTLQKRIFFFYIKYLRRK